MKGIVEVERSDRMLLDYAQVVADAIQSRSIYHLLVEHGCTWQAVPEERPPWAKPGPPGMCFMTSTRRMWGGQQACYYVEGIAISSSCIPVPITHAWNTDDNWRLIESTWKGRELAYYLGLVLQKQWVNSMVARTGYYGIIGSPVAVQAMLDTDTSEWLHPKAVEHRRKYGR